MPRPHGVYAVPVEQVLFALMALGVALISAAYLGVPGRWAAGRRARRLARHVEFRDRYFHPWHYSRRCECPCDCPLTTDYHKCVNCAAADFGGLSVE